MKPAPKCVIDRSRPCNACIAPDPRSCPYPFLLGGADDVGDGPDAVGGDQEGPGEGADAAPGLGS
ncbi:hypothetical protein [Streptomyces sp. GC420]|uniref:hypothetical protein n=1 Tax=Streptomyces sp. GC420 TaxID=2697568 RepID=UPI001414E884|nr:hypothetical protein [Streptomyces sp. GC420]NBM17288.1 hypothetical protein [Streptomyces sp. GC420]